jgi:hypothetical protein
MLNNGTGKTKVRAFVTAIIVAVVTAISITVTAPAGSTATSFIEQNWVSPPGWCLGVANDAAAGQVIQWACDGESDQSWHWGSENGFTGYYELVNGGGDCLGLSGGGTIAGTPVISGQCLGRADQYWRTAAECVRMTSHGNVDYWPLFSYAASSKGLYVIGSLAGTTEEGADMLLEGYITSCDFQFWDGLPDPLI